MSKAKYQAVLGPRQG